MIGAAGELVIWAGGDGRTKASAIAMVAILAMLLTIFMVVVIVLSAIRYRRHVLRPAMQGGAAGRRKRRFRLDPWREAGVRIDPPPPPEPDPSRADTVDLDPPPDEEGGPPPWA